MTGAKSTGTPGQMRLFTSEAAAPGEDGSAFAAVAAAFDPARLTQGRRLAGLTKKTIAQELGVSAVAVGQWESGTHPPRPDHVGHLAEVLEVPPAFLAGGRPYARLDDLRCALPQPAQDASTSAG